IGLGSSTISHQWRAIASLTAWGARRGAVSLPMSARCSSVITGMGTPADGVERTDVRYCGLILGCGSGVGKGDGNARRGDLLRGHRAVYDHHVAGHVRRGVRAQPQDGRRDLLRLAQTPDRHGRVALGASGGETGHQRSLDEPRTYRVDSNARPHVVEGRYLREAGDAVLAGGVGRVPPDA